LSVGAEVSVWCFEPDISHSNCSWWFIHNSEIFCSQYQSNQLCLFTSQSTCLFLMNAMLPATFTSFFALYHIWLLRSHCNLYFI